jgi:hypothetical protein
MGEQNTVEVMVAAASQAANHPKQSAIGKIIFFSQAVGNLAMLTINPQSAKPRPHRGPAQAKVEVANKR